jgi:hypothetical protein
MSPVSLPMRTEYGIKPYSTSTRQELSTRKVKVAVAPRTGLPWSVTIAVKLSVVLAAYTSLYRSIVALYESGGL